MIIASLWFCRFGPRRFGRCAVISHQDLLYGSMQMFEVLVGRLFDAIEVFRTPTAAVKWLRPAPKPARTLRAQ
jgi:hypothetical protein